MLYCSAILFKPMHHFRVIRVIKTALKRNHQDPVMLVPDFIRLPAICCLLLKNEDHISSVWPFSMYREDWIHLLCRHDTNDSKTVDFYESPIKWIIMISSRFCWPILFIITWIFLLGSPSILTWNMNYSKNANDHVHLWKLFQRKIGEMSSTKRIACQMNRLNQDSVYLFSLTSVLRCKCHLLIDDRMKNG
jgi:hypothetical protein